MSFWCPLRKRRRELSGKVLSYWTVQRTVTTKFKHKRDYIMYSSLVKLPNTQTINRNVHSTSRKTSLQRALLSDVTNSSYKSLSTVSLLFSGPSSHQLATEISSQKTIGAPFSNPRKISQSQNLRGTSASRHPHTHNERTYVARDAQRRPAHR